MAVSVVALVWAGQAVAQATLDVSTSVEDAPAPARILAMQPGTRTYLAELRNRWGRLEVPPGRYEVMLIPSGEGAVPVLFGPYSAKTGSVTDVEIGSGIRLAPGEDIPPLAWWRVVDARGEMAAQVVGRWGYTPLQPGRYRLEVPLPSELVSSDMVEVVQGSVADVALASLGIGRVVLEMPPKNHLFLFGDEKVVPVLEIDGERYDISTERQGDEIALWLEAGTVRLERRAGSFVDANQVEVRPGEQATVDFDLDEIAARSGLGMFELGPGTESIDRMTVVASRGDSALLSTPAPRSDVRYIAPAGATVSVVGSGGRRTAGPLKAGDIVRLPAPDEAAESQARLEVSLAVERPADGAEVDAKADGVTVLGQASQTTQAGVTKIVLVIDTSGSTANSAGSDVDGDGTDDTILEAEKTAAEELIAALLEVEQSAPGTAFAVSLVEFGDTARSVTPLMPLTDPTARDRLGAAVASLAHGAQGGSTFYDRAIDTALRVLDASEQPGPRIVLLVTDGKPSQIVPAIDAAARAGLGDTVLHTVGLGPDFRGDLPENVAYPPVVEKGPEILATMATFSAEGGRVWALPRPADIVTLVPSLPVLERQDAGIDSVVVRNETLDLAAEAVDLRRDGSFSASLPVRFGPPDAGWTNLLSVTAKGLDGAKARQEIRLLAAGLDPEIWKQAEKDRASLEEQAAELTERLARAERSAAVSTAEVARLEAVLAEDAAQAAAGTDGLHQCTEARQQCQGELRAALAQLLDPTPVPGGLVLTVPGDVLFDFDAAEVRPDAAQALRLAAVFLRDHEKSDLVVEGHTDSVGSESYNASLSLARAQAVLDWMVAEAGIAPDRIKAMGLGESRPVAEETHADGIDAPEGRQRNRRVEIRIVK